MLQRIEDITEFVLAFSLARLILGI